MNSFKAKNWNQTPLFLGGLLALWLSLSSFSYAEQPVEEPKAVKKAPLKWAPLPPNAKPLNKKQTVWIDSKEKRIYLKTQIALKEGMLEMLCCVKDRQKEHESILTFDGKAMMLHAGLIALGVKPGKAVKLYPKYIPPQGQELDLNVIWIDKKGKVQRTSAKNWIRTATRKYFVATLAKLPKGLKLPGEPDLRHDEKFKELFFFGIMSKKQKDACLAFSKEPQFQNAVREIYKKSQPKQFNAKWLFTGSKFVKDPKTGKEYYLAEEGRFICVANFPEATIDVTEKSSGENGALTYEAHADRVPPLGAPVLLEISIHKKAAEKKTSH